jgi:hypothetical protein
MFSAFQPEDISTAYFCLLQSLPSSTQCIRPALGLFQAKYSETCRIGSLCVTTATTASTWLRNLSANRGGPEAEAAVVSAKSLDLINDVAPQSAKLCLTDFPRAISWLCGIFSLNGKEPRPHILSLLIAFNHLSHFSRPGL